MIQPHCQVLRLCFFCCPTLPTLHCFASIAGSFQISPASPIQSLPRERVHSHSPVPISPCVHSAPREFHRGGRSGSHVLLYQPPINIGLPPCPHPHVARRRLCFSRCWRPCFSLLFATTHTHRDPPLAVFWQTGVPCCVHMSSMVLLLTIDPPLDAL